MARQDANEAFAQTAFLYGGNAAYIEQLYARYSQDPASVDPQWREFFAALKDESAIIAENARGASWKRPNWPQPANGELVSALDGNWAAVEAELGDKIKGKAQGRGVEISQSDVMQATRDSVRALMMIRAYRMRGHLHANLDPLNLQPRQNHECEEPCQRAGVDCIDVVYRRFVVSHRDEVDEADERERRG